ncbi:MAG TPA: hypothetical protein VG097_16025 [Gemmata sp.]|jgi:hypothetical protein|nr:hypothetical protein [Gemmata sp.]
MRTEQLSVARVRVYHHGIIPLWDLTSNLAITHLQRTYRFEQVQPVSPENKNQLQGVMFIRGYFPATESTTSAGIERLSFGSIELNFTTRDGDGHKSNDAMLQEVSNLCDEITPAHKGWVHAHQIEFFQTVWVGQLEIDPDNLIDPRVRKLLFPALSKSGTSEGVRRVLSRGVQMRITTQTTDPKLVELGLQIPDEEFRLEPRTGRLLHERQWFSTSAIRSEDHIRLLEEIEKAYRE